MATNIDSETSTTSSPAKDLLTPEEHPEFWYIHGKAYDLTSFIDHHPGGSRALNLARGRDCTEMFESYHCLSDKPRQIMSKFEVGPQHDYQPVFDFKDPKVNAFYTELVAEVRQWVTENNIDIKCSNVKMTWISLLFLVTCWLTVKFYWLEGAYWSIFVTPVLWWVVFVNTFHDASHFAISRNLWVTNFWTYIYPWFSSPTTWDHQHVIAHHVHTNIHKMDPDLSHGMPVFRINTKYHYRPHFQFQIYWTWLVWGVATFWLANVYDIFAVFQGKYHGIIRFKKLEGWRLVGHLLGRLLAIFLHFGIPLMLFPLGQAVIWALSFNFIFSCCFMAATQVNHLSPACMAAAAERHPCWAHHQVVSSQDFSHDSLFWWIFSGGLNFQIEHHLFPGINHEHLPAIKPIVMRLCKKYQIPYPYCQTYSEAFWQYVEVVKRGSLKTPPGF